MLQALSPDGGLKATQVLFQLIGSVALLIWGVRLVRTGMIRALGPELRRFLAASTRNRFGAFASGLAATLLLQSSTATALIVGSFAAAGLIALPGAVAIMLGADVGSTLAAQVLALEVNWLWTLFVAAGVVLFMSRERVRPRGVARAMIGLGLMLLALLELRIAARALQGSPAVQMVLEGIASEPIVALVVGAAAAWLIHSSLAFVLFVLSLAAAGLVPAPAAVALVLGANIGGAVAPVVAQARAPAAARRVVLGNLGFRALVALAALPFTRPIAAGVQAIVADPGTFVVVFHTLFNVAVAVVGLILVGPASRLLEGWIADTAGAADEARPRHLDTTVLDTPSEALACAMRETLRMGDAVAEMLKKAQAAIEGNDFGLVTETERADTVVDRLYEAIKLYLVAVSKSEMSDDESRRFVEVLTFTTNLEHIGDIIDKNLMELAAKKIRNRLSFSPEGLAELRDFHAHILETMRLALNVFATRDAALARRLFSDKTSMRAAERDAAERHFGRLKEGRLESLETSAIHLDILRDFKRIHGHLTSVAYPILEAGGELATSRLRGAEDAPQREAATGARG